MLIAFGCIAKEAPKFYAGRVARTPLDSDWTWLRAPPLPNAVAVSRSGDAPPAAGAKLQADVAAWLLLAAQMLCSICAGKRWAARAAAAPTSRSRATHHTSIASLDHRVRQWPKPHGPPRLSHPAALRYRRVYNELLLKVARTPAARRCRPTFRTVDMYTASILWLLSYPQQIPTDVHIGDVYTASILWLLLYLGVQGKLRDAVSAENLQGVARRPVVVCIILIMSSVGTGFFLASTRTTRGRYRHRRARALPLLPAPRTPAAAGAVEVALATLAHTTPPPASRLSRATTPFPPGASSPLLSWALFGTPLDAFTVLAALMVGLGVALTLDDAARRRARRRRRKRRAEAGGLRRAARESRCTSR